MHHLAVYRSTLTFFAEHTNEDWFRNSFCSARVLWAKDYNA